MGLGARAIDDDCVLDRIAVWHLDGRRLFALGNGEPKVEESGVRSAVHEGTECSVDASCDGAGFLSIMLGDSEPALPDGVPITFAFPGDAHSYSVFNWGLQFNQSCEARGRWAVVPTAHASMFE